VRKLPVPPPIKEENEGIMRFVLLSGDDYNILKELIEERKARKALIEKERKLLKMRKLGRGQKRCPE